MDQYRMIKKSKAEQIYECIRREIGHEPPGTRLGSIRSLMRRYNTSQFSITGAIHKLEEAKLLHRTPRGELLVSSPGEPSRERIGIWMPDWPSPVHFQRAEKLRREIHRHGFEAVRINYSQNYSFRQLESDGLRAIIAILQHRLTPHEVYHLGNSPIPVVIMGEIFDCIELSFVSADPFLNGLLAAGYFFRHAHRKLAIALSEPHNAICNRRRDGFLSFARATGCPVELIDCRVNDGENSAAATHVAFSEQLRTKRPKFTALYMMSSATAFSAISALVECGFRVPDDISVIAADDVDQAADFLPPVTCVDANADLFAQKVVGATMRLLQEPGLPCIQEIVDSEVVERGSVRTLLQPATVEIHSNQHREKQK